LRLWQGSIHTEKNARFVYVDVDLGLVRAKQMAKGARKIQERQDY